MNINDASAYKKQLELLSTLGIVSAPLKAKLRIGKMWRSHQHTCNHGGGCGRMKRRSEGWRKHSKGPANVPSGRVSLRVMKALDRGEFLSTRK